MSAQQENQAAAPPYGPTSQPPNQPMAQPAYPMAQPPPYSDLPPEEKVPGQQYNPAPGPGDPVYPPPGPGGPTVYPPPGPGDPTAYPPTGPPQGNSAAYAPTGYNTSSVQATTVHTSAPATQQVVQVQSYGDYPVATKCLVCQQQVVTICNKTAGGMAWLIFGILCFFGCWFGCCLIPFCVDGLKDVHHHCPSCHARIASFHRL